MNAFKNKALSEIGSYVEGSQQLASSYLKNQVPETNYLARTARPLGAVASSAFGAGFGGSVWALVDVQAAHEFMEAWKKRYLDAFPESTQRAQFFVDHTGNGALVGL